MLTGKGGFTAFAFFHSSQMNDCEIYGLEIFQEFGFSQEIPLNSEGNSCTKN
jgi:hypothetical protein